MARATGLDAERRQVTLDRGERLDYDSLIVACGAQTSYFGKDDWAERSYGLKTLADAVKLRNRIYGSLEEAERAADPAERDRWLTFVVIGGGPTGVELAGELAIITKDTMKGYFARIQPAKDPARRRRARHGRVQPEAVGEGRRLSGRPRGDGPRARPRHLDRRRRCGSAGG
jgi:NADH:ubiquinone reductase (H+-translocating)